jgi:hypothetical protein
MQWLILEQDHLNMVISGTVHEPKSKQELRVVAWVPAAVRPQGLSQFGAGTVVTSGLARMQATPSLAGERGDFRSHMANTLGAKNDLEAVDLCLSRYAEKPSTQRSYRKEAERFLLWYAQELKKPLAARTRAALILGLTASRLSKGYSALGAMFSVEFHRPVFADAKVKIESAVVGTSMARDSVQRVKMQGACMTRMGGLCVQATGGVRVSLAA